MWEGVYLEFVLLLEDDCFQIVDLLILEGYDLHLEGLLVVVDKVFFRGLGTGVFAHEIFVSIGRMGKKLDYYSPVLPPVRRY